jgi:hypothetical protein
MRNFPLYDRPMFLTEKRHLGQIIVLLCVFSSSARTQQPDTTFEVTRKSVVFIYAQDGQGKEHPDGTGFLLFVPTKTDPTRGYGILVTARHMADPGWLSCPTSGDLVAKFNKRNFDPLKDDIGTVDYPLKNQTWIVPEDSSVDIAYTLLDVGRVSTLDVENSFIRLSELPSASEAKSVGIGATIMSAGLLENASGTKRNYPIFKFGNISSIPDEKISVPGCNNTIKFLTEWMVAASLVPGNSGSPVVLNPSMFQGGRPFIIGVQSISFLGSDVAGMAPIRYLLESIRKLHLEDADLSKPAETTAPAQPTPTSIPPNFSAKPGPLPKPN